MTPQQIEALAHQLLDNPSSGTNNAVYGQFNSPRDGHKISDDIQIREARKYIEAHPALTDIDQLQRQLIQDTLPEEKKRQFFDDILKNNPNGDADKFRAALAKYNISLSQLLFIVKYGYVLDGQHYPPPSGAFEVAQVGLVAKVQTDGSINDIVNKINNKTVDLGQTPLTQVVSDTLKDKYGIEPGDDISNAVYGPVMKGVGEALQGNSIYAQVNSQIAQSESLTGEQLKTLVAKVKDITADNISEKREEILAALVSTGKNVTFDAVTKGLQGYFQLLQTEAALKSADKEADARSLEAQVKIANLKDLPHISNFYNTFILCPDGKPARSIFEATHLPGYDQAFQELPSGVQEQINKTLEAEKNARLAVPVTEGQVAQSENLTAGTIAGLIHKFGALTPDNIEKNIDGIRETLGEAGIRNIDVTTIADGYQKYAGLQQTLYALKSAGPKSNAEVLDAQIKSLKLSEIGQLKDLYSQFMEPDANGNPTKTFLQVSKDPKFQLAWQNLPPPLQTAIKTSLADQAEVFLTNLKVEGQEAQLGAQIFKYQQAMKPRLEKAGIKTADDLLKAAQDQTLQGLIDTQTDGDGKPIPEEVRKALMADFQSQIGLQSSAAQAITAKAQSTYAEQDALVKKMSLAIDAKLYGMIGAALNIPMPTGGTQNSGGWRAIADAGLQVAMNKNMMKAGTAFSDAGLNIATDRGMMQMGQQYAGASLGTAFDALFGGGSSAPDPAPQAMAQNVPPQLPQARRAGPPAKAMDQLAQLSPEAGVTPDTLRRLHSNLNKRGSPKPGMPESNAG